MTVMTVRGCQLVEAGSCEMHVSVLSRLELERPTAPLHRTHGAAPTKSLEANDDGRRGLAYRKSPTHKNQNLRSQ
jgi:hypothetical protein